MVFNANIPNPKGKLRGGDDEKLEQWKNNEKRSQSTGERVYRPKNILEHKLVELSHLRNDICATVYRQRE
jgi:hypothetical protein